ncbi:hypothetical protein FJZ31_05390 [Candidatus Poribacteria bacterium]|nr:hypothetical protein [Candidatus Poribacteria bacterium]
MRYGLRLILWMFLGLFAVGTLGLGISSTQAQNIIVLLPEKTVSPGIGTTVDIPVSIDKFTDEQLIDGINVTIEYDSSVVDIADPINNVRFGTLLAGKNWSFLQRVVVIPTSPTLPNGKRYRVDMYDPSFGGSPLKVSAPLPADFIVVTFTIQSDNPEKKTDLIFIDKSGTAVVSAALGKDYPVDISDKGDIALPVKLSALGAIWHPNGTKIFWEAESQQGNLGWNIYRSEAKDGKFVKINGELIRGAGTTSNPMKYSFIDKDAEKGKVYYYYLEDISFNGEKHRTDLIKSIPINKIISWGDIKRSALR